LSAPIFIHSGRCQDLASVIADCDVQIVDPPYRAHVHKSAVSQSKRKGTRKRDLGFEHLSRPLRVFIAQAAAKVPRWSLVYSDVESTDLWRRSCVAAGATYIRPIPWIRWGMPQLTGDRPPAGLEIISLFWGGSAGQKKSWNGPGNLTELTHEEQDETSIDVPALRHTRLGDAKKRHKTQKPLDQALDLVTWFSDEEHTVLDLTGGRMTTGVACALLGRAFVGADADEVEAALGRERVAAALDGQLSGTDPERLLRWAEATVTEASAVLGGPETEPAKERARRRLAAVQKVEKLL